MNTSRSARNIQPKAAQPSATDRTRRERIEQHARDILAVVRNLDDGEGDERETLQAVCTAALCETIFRSRS